MEDTIDFGNAATGKEIVLYKTVADVIVNQTKKQPAIGPFTNTVRKNILSKVILIWGRLPY